MVVPDVLKCKSYYSLTTLPNRYVVRQLSSRTRHHVLAMAAPDKSLSMVWWSWHISISQLCCCCCWSMAVSFWVASFTVCVCFGVPLRECRSLNLSSKRTLNFLLNLERVETKSERCLQVYGDNAMKKTAVYKWVKRFSEGRESVTDEERSGWPATSRTEENMAKNRQILRENRRLAGWLSGA